MHASKPPLENDAAKWCLRTENTGDGGVIPGDSLMWVGIPREVKTGEKRVALLPQEVRAIVDKVQSDVAKALSNPEVRERFVAQGAEPSGNTPEQFTAFIRAESDKWTRVVKFSNAKVD